MSSFDSWLEPLRAYPSALVLVAFVLAVGAVIWVIAKVIKWSIYIIAALAFVGIVGAFALWLWG